jgi:hypothetical protein
VYGSSAQPTNGACLLPPCAQNIVRWEVRVVVTNRNATGIWAWSEGFRQFYQEYPVDLRGRTLALSAFNMK